MHPSITTELICDRFEDQMTSLDNPAFCKSCGDESENDSDCENGKCEVCGENQVFGIGSLVVEMC